MGVTYYRRYRMEFDLTGGLPASPQLPEGFVWEPWRPVLLERHAVTKYGSFCDELDARIFSSLGALTGCHRLMTEITRQRSFVPAATWLIVSRPDEFAEPLDCGTIQGLGPTPLVGAIQNVGVLPQFRGFGLGRALVLKALWGYHARGFRRVQLQVTADNEPALELYRSIGFRHVRTLYRQVDEPAVPAPAGDHSDARVPPQAAARQAVPR